MSTMPRVPPRRAWREYLGLYRGRWTVVTLAVTASIAPSALLAGAALLVRRVFDVALPERDAGQLVSLVLAIVSMQLSGQALLLIARAVVLRVTKRVIADLREKLMETMLIASRSFLDNRKSSELHTLIVDDSERVDSMSNACITTLLPAAAATATLTAVILAISAKLTAVLVLFLPVAFFATRTVLRRTKRSVVQFHESYRDFSGSTATVVRLLDLIRMQGAEEIERSGSAARIDQLRTASARMAWLQTAMMIVHQAVLAMAVAMALLVGGLMVIAGQITLGELMSFLVATALLRNQLVPAGPGVSTVVAGEESLVRLFGFLTLAPPESYRGTRKIEFDGEVALEAVSFGYDERRPVLEQVSLRIRSGSTVALTGRNGAGKSTVLRLILGFYSPQRGRLTADGVPYGDLDIRSLRRAIGVVMQDALILDGTVRQNIVYGVDGVGEEDVREAVRLACAEAMMERLPEGLDTPVGENGILLSGGQKQRIAIARALLKKPRLLVLDEPTRHLDREAVEGLLQVLRSAEWPHATLVVSHDEEVAAEADVVVRVANRTLEVVRDGKAAS